VEVLDLRRHHRFDGLIQVYIPADDPAEDVALGQDADEASVGPDHEDRIAGSGALD
jgi:hypothetical protein